MKTETSRPASRTDKVKTGARLSATAGRAGDVVLFDRSARSLAVAVPSSRPALLEIEQGCQHRTNGPADISFSDDEICSGFREGEFALFFQPQVELQTGKVTGAEALLRWRHRRHGLLAPGSFLDALEESEIAREVGHWIIDEACKVGAITNAGGRSTRIGVNLFSGQLYDHGLQAHIAQALDLRRLPAEMLELEITETTVLHWDAEVIAQLGRIRSMGVGIAFDDYGTGFASLSLLKTYPLTRLKIDREFVTNIDSDASDMAIVDAIVTLAKKLELEVIAEGMENQAQVDALLRLGCTQGQGYFFARPMPSEQFQELTFGEAPGGRRIPSMKQPYTKV